jgi:hypothetical protein
MLARFRPRPRRLRGTTLPASTSVLSCVLRTCGSAGGALRTWGLHRDERRSRGNGALPLHALSRAERSDVRMDRDGICRTRLRVVGGRGARRNPFAGFVGLSAVDFDSPFCPAVEIGWRLASTCWSRGYATDGRLAAQAAERSGERRPWSTSRRAASPPTDITSSSPVPRAVSRAGAGATRYGTRTSSLWI